MSGALPISPHMPCVQSMTHITLHYFLFSTALGPSSLAVLNISTQCSTVSVITFEVLWDLYWWNMPHTGRYTNTAEFQLGAIKFSQ